MFEKKVLLEAVNSPVNGELKAIRDPEYGVYISGGGLDQSGRAVEIVWRESLLRVYESKKEINSCLILGLGGGSIAKLVREFWPSAKITGVDVDPVIIELGKKHMGLEELEIEIEIEDAFKFVQSLQLSAISYDLICVDTYVGDQYPKKLESGEFLDLIRSNLTRSGIVIFNRTYHEEFKKSADNFEKKLRKIFGSVVVIYPQLNAMYVCMS